MADSSVWANFKNQFRTLGQQDASGELRVAYNYVAGSIKMSKEEWKRLAKLRNKYLGALRRKEIPSPDELSTLYVDHTPDHADIVWKKLHGPERLRSDFEVLVTQAGSQITRPANRTPRDVWFDALKGRCRKSYRNGCGSRYVGDSIVLIEWGWIESLWEASADYCAELEEKAQQEEWQRGLSEILDSLRVSEPDPDFVWSEHAKKFENIPGQGRPGKSPHALRLLCVDEIHPESDVCGGPETKASYKALAEEAAIARGYRSSDDGIKAWLILLILNSPKIDPWFKPFVGPGGQIENLCQASVSYCQTLNTEAYAIRRRQSSELQAAPHSLEEGRQALERTAGTTVPYTDQREPQGFIVMNCGIATITFKGQTLAPLNGQLKSIRRLARLLEMGEWHFDNPSELETALDGQSVCEHGSQTVADEAAAQGLHLLGSVIEDQDSIRISRNNVRRELQKTRVEIAEYDRLIADAKGGPEAGILQQEREQLHEKAALYVKEMKSLKVQSNRVSDYDKDTKKALNRVRNSLFDAVKQIRKTPNGKELADFLEQGLRPFQFPFSYHPTYTVNWTIQKTSTV